MKKAILTFIAIVIASLTPATLSALEYGGVGGKPANPDKDNPRTSSIFIYELQPGQSVTDGVEVSNTSDEEKRVKITAVDSTVASDGAFACAQDSEEKADVGAWITIPNDTVTLAPGAKQIVNFILTAPNNASVGEHGGCIAMQAIQDGESASEGDGVVLSFRSAIRISVTIPGDIVKALTISKVTLEPNPRVAAQYIVQPSITNTGNVSLDTTITTKLVSLFGIPSGTATSTYPVLPGSTARWNFTHASPFWGGWYRASVEASYNSNTQDGLGESTNQTNTTTNGDSGFVFIPPHPVAFMIELALLAGIVIALILLIRRLRLNRAVKSQWRHHTVVKGDSLQKIAKHYGVSWKKLATVNKIRAPYHLEPGTDIKVPPRADDAE